MTIWRPRQRFSNTGSGVDGRTVSGQRGDAAWRAEAGVWRERLVAHLKVRGRPWVADGRLGLRPESQLHSPNWQKPIPAPHGE